MPLAETSQAMGRGKLRAAGFKSLMHFFLAAVKLLATAILVVMSFSETKVEISTFLPVFKSIVKDRALLDAEVPHRYVEELIVTEA